MHKLNEKAYIDPEEWHRKTAAALTAQRAECPDPSDRVSGTVTLLLRSLVLRICYLLMYLAMFGDCEQAHYSIAVIALLLSVTCMISYCCNFYTNF